MGKLKDEKGFTLIDMLIAILIFILASMLIVSVVGKAIDKPKVAGIKGTLKHYEAGASLLLHETVNVPDIDMLRTELNNDLEEAAKFKDGKSTIKNAYSNPYKVKVAREENQTAIVVETKGKKEGEYYKVVVIKEGEIVESCTVGFGRNDSGLVTLESDLCGDEPAIGETIDELEKGTYIKFAGKWWTLLEPSTGYIHMNVGQELGKAMVFDLGSNKYDPSRINSIGYYLNTTWLGKVSEAEQRLVVERNWGVGGLTDAEGGERHYTPKVSMADMRVQENSEKVKAKVGLLTVSEYREYSKHYGGGWAEYSGNESTWLITPYLSLKLSVWHVSDKGELIGYNANTNHTNQRIRPALNLKSGTKIAPDGTVIP